MMGITLDLDTKIVWYTATWVPLVALCHTMEVSGMEQFFVNVLTGITILLIGNALDRYIRSRTKKKSPTPPRKRL